MKRIKKDNKIIKFQSHGVTGTVEKDVPQNTNEPNINSHKLFEGLGMSEKTSVLKPEELTPEKIRMIAIDSLRDENCRDEDEYFSYGYLRKELSGVFDISEMELDTNEKGTNIMVYTVPKHYKHLERNKGYLLDVFKQAYKKAGQDIKDITIKSILRKEDRF